MNIYLSIFLRSLFAFFTVLLLTRLMGKRQISQLNFFDYIVGISIGTITASIAMETTANFTVYLTALMTFAFLQIISAYLAIKSKIIRKLVVGEKTTLIENGKILENNMLKTRFNMDDLTSKLREKNVFRLQDVEFAYLEPDGKVSVMKKSNQEPVTPEDLNIYKMDKGVGQFIIVEGQIIETTLRKNGLTKAWLKTKLKQQSVNDEKEVMFAQVDNLGHLYIDLYEDKR